MLKDCIQHSLTKEPSSFWTNHLGLALLLLHMTVSRMMGGALFFIVISCQPLLLSLPIPRLPSLPNHPTLDEENAYLAKVSHIVTQLQGLGVDSIR